MHRQPDWLNKSIALLCTAAVMWVLAALPVRGQGPAGTVPPRGSVHYLLDANMPPGALGAARLAGRSPVHGYYQPVAIYGPDGSQLALAASSGFTPSVEGPLQAGLLVGAAYRVQVSQIPGQPGVEIFPTVEVIDRLHPPPGQTTRFPIPVHIGEDDLAQALAGRLVTRVIYLEDPQTALPLADAPQTQRSFDVRADLDPLQEADRLGRPVAVLRIGSRVPPRDPVLIDQFLLGSPPWLPIPSEPKP